MSKARTLTIKESTTAARAIFASAAGIIDEHGWRVESALRTIGTGFYIPSTAYADGHDTRTQGNFAKWLRRNAVDAAAQIIERREAFQSDIS